MTGGIVVHISRLVVIVQAGFDLMGRMSRAKFARRFRTTEEVWPPGLPRIVVVVVACRKHLGQLSVPLSLCVGNKRSESSCHRCIYANGHVLMWLMFVKHGANMGPGGALDLVRRGRQINHLDRVLTGGDKCSLFRAILVPKAL